QWALDLGAHVVRVSHSEPFWNEEGGRVMVKQRTRLYGLELETRAVSYGKIDPVRATEIFIREGLVNDTIAFPLDFIAHNRAVRGKLEDLLTRARDSGYLNLDEAAYRFYAARLLEGSGRRPDGHAIDDGGRDDRRYLGVSSVAELVDLVRERRGAEPRFLMMEPENLRDPDTIAHDADAFPEALPLRNSALPLNYAYKPGQNDDGVTLDVSVSEAAALTHAALDWAVPGHLEAKVEHYLRALPKELRRGFVPLADTAKNLAQHVAARDRLTDRREALTDALAVEIAERFRVAIDPAAWADKPLPDHLRVRVRVVDAAGREVVASRELAEVHAALHLKAREASVSVAREDPGAWRAARAKWETPEQTSWTWKELPERVRVAEQAGATVYAFPGLHAATDGVARRLFKTPEEAREATRAGVAALLERQLSHELGWLERDLRALRELGALPATLAPVEKLREDAFESIRRWVTDPERVGVGLAAPGRPGFDGRNEASAATPAGSENRPQLTASGFATALEKAKADLRGLVPRFVDLLREILSARQELLVEPHPYPGLDKDLAALLPPDFLRRTPFERLRHFPRYLKAMKLRAERARKNPTKDVERAAQLAPYVAAIAKVAGGAVPSPRKDAKAGEGTHPPSVEAGAFRWLVEEFRVSLFAQELGTAEPVSTVKLDRELAALQVDRKTRPEIKGALPPPTAKPILAAPVAAKKTSPLKNLGALDRLFPR
ncbi:MAG: DUF3418 domain-containing protein, partial [Opitutaceae bacterium]